jgi:hypothetical protein
VSEGVKLYVGGSAATVNSRPMLLTGPRMFNPANPVKPAERFTAEHTPLVEGWIDSGAFQDVKPDARLSPAEALDRQLRWEGMARQKWESPDWTLARLVSYDRLIDEKWINGKKRKERWSVTEADAAVRETIEAAAYLASQRGRLAPRGLVLACQGVDAAQYAECAKGVLAHCRPGDVFGLGGWCILGIQRHWLPTFWAAMRAVLPLVVAAGLAQVHVFGVLWRPALGGLLWLADQCGLAVSTDSSSPVLAACWKSATPSNKKCDRWEDNVEWWRRELSALRGSEYYREPPTPRRIATLFDECDAA